MLWYQAWRESQVRFTLSAVTLAGICLCLVVFQADAGAESYAAYIWKALYDGPVRDLFMVLVLFLGLGGLLRERAHGTAHFTLALPVSRRRLVAVRAVTGLLETAVFAVIPALVIPTLSPIVHRSYPFSQALQFSLLSIGGGAVIFAASFLLSTIVAGRYSSAVVGFLALLSYALIVHMADPRSFPSIDLFSLMNGEGRPYFQS